MVVVSRDGFLGGGRLWGGLFRFTACALVLVVGARDLVLLCQSGSAPHCVRVSWYLENECFIETSLRRSWLAFKSLEVCAVSLVYSRITRRLLMIRSAYFSFFQPYNLAFVETFFEFLVQKFTLKSLDARLGFDKIPDRGILCRSYQLCDLSNRELGEEIE